MNYLKQDYYKRGFGLGKRKRAKPTCCLAPFDFSEFRKQVENVENHILTLTDHKTSSKLNCESLNKSQKKREEKEKEKEKSKEINCTIISLVPYNKRIIELIFMWKELFPKVYNKLITICTRYLPNDDIILTYQQKIHKLNNLNSEDEASCQEAIDEFVMKTYQCILRANAKLSESIINMMTNGMKVDYEMADAKAQIDYCSPAMQVLAITDKANSEDDYTFINPVTYCTIEEVD